MASEAQHTGLWRTILFVDVCGSTKLYETLGNTRAQAIIATTLAMLAECARKHLGTIVKEIGDEVMCTFGTAGEAAEAAIDMQRSLKQAIAAEDIAVKSLMIRAGLHCGPVISQVADIFGDAVNVAARVVAHAKPGQILTTRPTVARLPEEVKSSIRPVGSTQVKGKKEAIELYEVIWEHENLTQLQDVAATRPSGARLLARLRDRTVELGPELGLLRMGRGAENEFVIEDPLASRLHARIEHRRDRFVLVDQSLNGTYVQRAGGPEIVLRRDELALEGSGLIGLGRSTAGQHDQCVEFIVQSTRPVPPPGTVKPETE